MVLCQDNKYRIKINPSFKLFTTFALFKTSMAVYSTEITSDLIPSDNPIHQRLLKPYMETVSMVNGRLLEIGCGEGRGVDYLLPRATHYTAVDKNKALIKRLAGQYPSSTFLQASVPPLPFDDKTFDTVVSFQVIEHIKNDHDFLQEIKRVLTPGGKAILTTPNGPMSLSRNPWHVREYTEAELTKLCSGLFEHVTVNGIAGNRRVMEYYERNKASVNKLMRFDVLDLQHRLPAAWLRIPYEWMNRINRNKLKHQSDELVRGITHKDYYLSDSPETSLDLFCVLH